MRFPSIFGSLSKQEDDEMRQKREESEARIVQMHGDLRNQAQVIQSGSRRLITMGRTMDLLRKGSYDPHR